MSHAPRKIVFNMPSLLPEGGGDRAGPRRASPPAPSPASREAPADGGEVRKLGTLMEVGQALAGTLNLQAGLYAVLEVLERRCGAVRGAVTLLEEASGMLVVEAGFGYPKSTGRVRYRLGEGITGKVAESKGPAIVPPVSGEEATFVCVPILLDGAAAGTLAIELALAPERDAERMIKVLRIAGGMISQSLRIQRLVDAERQRLVEENTQLRQELRERYEFTNIVGNSGPMRQVYEQVSQVVGTSTTVLIRGESGTGKELIAHALHHHSARAGKPFVRVNCAALPETLVESELFGYERGAFTGAQARRKGRFEQADGGTLFLDEIGELSLSTQVKLLRVLQEREFERLGGNGTVRVDVRLITATNKDLEKALADGTFREDLYYRLNGVHIHLPALRDRPEDILDLAEHFLSRNAAKAGKEVRGFHETARKAL
ncbi:MAG: sigma 54-interacting transcriptional regulator, partial [Gemmatimonadales bacterium]